MLNLLHINSYYAKDIFFKNLYDEQFYNKINVQVFVPAHYGFEVSKGKHGEYTSVLKCFNKYDRYIFHVKHWKILGAIKKRYSVSEFDIMHAHSLFSNGYIAYKLFEEFEIPYIVAVRDTDLNLFFAKLFHLRQTGIKILENSKKIIFLSLNYKEQLLDKYIPRHLKQEIDRKSSIIPNGIDNFWLDNKTKASKSLTNPINIIYAGKIDNRKNPSITAKACQKLIEDGYKMQFTVIGKIENSSQYKRLMCYDFVEHFDFMPKSELINKFRNAHIFVMPSITETFGLVYVEAMSQGLPVIYTRGQGFDGQFADGLVGYAVDCHDEFDIAKKIEMIINKYAEMSKACIEKCETFKWDGISSKYMEIYGSI